MFANQLPLSWTTIILTLVIAAVATGVTIGALGYVMALPAWLPTAALGGVVGGLGAFLLQRRRAQMSDMERR